MKSFKKVMLVIVCFALVAVIGVGILFFKKKENVPNAAGEKITQTKQQNVSGNSFIEEGTTTMSTVSQMPEFTLNRILMYVEEVYVAAGDTVAEGDALFKIAASGLEEAKAYYTRQITNAKDSLKEAEAAYESGKLDASYVKLDAETKAANAAAVLETSLAEVDAGVDEKYDKWQESAYKISAYRDNLYNNIYYVSAGIPEKEEAVKAAQNAYTQAQAAYMAAGITYEAAKQNFNAAVAELSAVAAGNGESSLTMEEAAEQVVTHYNILLTVEPLYESAERTGRELQQAKQTLEQANSNYQRNEEQAKKSLEQLESNVEALQENYEAALRDAETKKLKLQNEYELSILEGAYAINTYNKTIEKLEASVESAEKSLTNLQEEEAALLALEDGIVRADRSGTLASVTYDVSDVLFSSNAFVTYYETSVLTISVEIEQENIAKVAVGDEVSVQIGSNRSGNVTGKVASIASSATTGRSVSDVTYAVVIEIENANNRFSAGSSATVSFESGE